MAHAMTLRLSDGLVRALKADAARQGITLHGQIISVLSREYPTVDAPRVKRRLTVGPGESALPLEVLSEDTLNEAIQEAERLGEQLDD